MILPAARRWLIWLATGLFALAAVAAPSSSSRMLVERAVYAVTYAMPDGTLPVLCHGGGDPAGHDDPHLHLANCLACVLVAAPGVLATPPLGPRRLAAPKPAAASYVERPPRAQDDRTTRRARAPPPPPPTLA